MILWAVLLLAFFASFLLTAALRAYALRRSLIDVPNARALIPYLRHGAVAFQ